MLQIFPTVLTEINAGNTLKNHQMKLDKSYIFCIKQNKITKKVYNNIMNSIKLQNEYYMNEFRK